MAEKKSDCGCGCIPLLKEDKAEPAKEQKKIAKKPVKSK